MKSSARAGSGSARWRVLRPSLIISLCSVVLLCSCASQRASTPSSEAPITAGEILKHIEYLAWDELGGRRSGTRQCEKAAEYIAREFERYGLAPAGNEGTFFQDFDFVYDVRLGKKNSLSVSVGEKTHSYEVDKEFLPLAFSENAAIAGELVFAGYGISAPDLKYDDYEGIDVRDKIVLALRYGLHGDDPKSQFDKYAAIRYKAMTAREKGAAGLLIVTGPESDRDDELIPLRYDASLQGSGIAALSISRTVAETVMEAAGKNLGQIQRMIDSTVTPQSFPILGVRCSFRADVVQEKRKTSNVIGLLEGNDPALKHETLVIGAHYDHLGLGEHGSRTPDRIGEIHNGADDNASGVAAVLELAENLAASRNDLRRSILFIAFSAEEIGLLGSSYYVDHPVVGLDSTVAMLNIDMVGRLTDNKLIIQGVGTSAVWDSLIQHYNAEAGFDLALKQSGYAPGDNTSFYARKIPVLFFFTDIHNDYHTPDDDAAKINDEGEERVVRYIRSIAVDVNTMQTRPMLAKVEEDSVSPSAQSFRVSMGTVPDFAADVKGVKLAGVKEGGPAEKAGIRAGDVLTRVGPKEITNLYDYAFALGEFKPGDVVEVIVIRDGQPLTLSVTLERRK